ncbi:YjbH domain-containing protein [Loktanella sp. SALINAS62]|uniref:YjbH domain-containing protein n=1 Tax=Loktanella sp. SALINAS62 TaxID=2706124 RepID=UPI001B8CF27C|nr:YjbH domain-containing protein [Loktanella sp. SALINAS62]MBS1302332.1 YjbH domain-containing protein [Loktanella sp. SALINAS62]
MKLRYVRTTSYGAILCCLAATAQAEGPTYTNFGTTGLLEMPTAESAASGELATTLSYSDTAGYRTTLTFQLTERLSGSFRYAIFDIYGIERANGERRTFRTYDRSFDIEYRLTNEGQYMPAIAVGLRDFLGTGRYSSEYVVGTKSIGSNLKVTGGLGWGRMGERNGVSNPLGGNFENRNEVDVFDEDAGVNTGGQLSVKQWFRGDVAPFAGVEYNLSPDLSFKAEYSSIAYEKGLYTPAVDVSSPLNFGVSYRPRPGMEFGANYLYGNEFGLRATFTINPNERPTYSGLDVAPAPVKPRTEAQRAAQSWNRGTQPAIREALTGLLDVEGIDLIGLEMTDRTARVRYVNNRFRSEAQAAGRVSRMMTQVMPDSIETFVLEPSRRGVPLSAITVPRTQLEDLENTVGSTEAMFDALSVTPAGPTEPLDLAPVPSPRFEWGIGPYLDFLLFTPGDPVTADVGLAFDARYQVNRNLSFVGRTSISALGERDPVSTFVDSNDYVNVRTDTGYYGLTGGLRLDRLYAAYVDRLAPEVYGRLTAGYLEKMYGGVSGEVLYAPVDKSWAIGAELNYAKLRDQDMGFDFALYETQPNGDRVEVGDYDVVTGHLSGYYDIGDGFHAQVDVGKYLAGDYGATFSLDREFENGWTVGGFFTFTDMPFSQFGEGSFDKGIRLTIPADYFVGSPTRRSVNTGVRSLTRDGGARLQVAGRLYNTVRDGNLNELSDTSGRFWR